MSKLLRHMQANVDAMRRIAALTGKPSSDPAAVADHVASELEALERLRAAYRPSKSTEEHPMSDGSGPTCCPPDMAVWDGEEAQS